MIFMYFGVGWGVLLEGFVQLQILVENIGNFIEDILKCGVRNRGFVCLDLKVVLSKILVFFIYEYKMIIM